MNKRLWVKLEDDKCRERLVAIAVHHTKLALEFLNRNTSIQRRLAILSEIAILRIERDALLNDKPECNCFR